MKKENILYLSNENAQLIVGTDDHKDMTKIYEYKTYPLAEGSMINGVITDEFEIKNILKQIAEEGYQEVSLVIDSGQILTKAVIVPKMNRKQLLQFVKDELSSVGENSEDLVYDYAYMRDVEDGNQAQQILCCAVERKLLSSYIDLFKECKITIKSIDYAMNIISKIANELLNTSDQAYLLSIIDGNNLISALFENQRFKLSYRSRVLAARQSESFKNEVLNNIANIFQFSKTGEHSIPLERVYLCNLMDNEVEIVERIKDSLSLEAEVLPTSPSIYVVNEVNKEPFYLDQYILPVGHLFKR